MFTTFNFSDREFFSLRTLYKVNFCKTWILIFLVYKSLRQTSNARWIFLSNFVKSVEACIYPFQVSTWKGKKLLWLLHARKYKMEDCSNSNFEFWHLYTAELLLEWNFSKLSTLFLLFTKRWIPSFIGNKNRLSNRYSTVKTIQIVRPSPCLRWN